MWRWFCVGGVSGVSKCGDNVCRGNGGECGDGSDESGDGGAEVVAVLVAGVKDGAVNVVVLVA